MSAPAERTGKSIGRARLHSQGIFDVFDTARATTPLDVVTRLGALQAQDYPGVLWSIGLRTSCSMADTEAAFERREIVRTWPMRGTLHVIPAVDARWMLGLLTPRVFSATASRRANLGLDEQVLAHATAVCFSALEGGKRLTRTGMLEAFDSAGIPTTGQRGYHLLFNLSMARRIVFGPRVGKDQTFVLFDEWLAESPERPADEALCLLSQRYFTGHGPATVKDFAGWTGLTMADAKRGLADAADVLVSHDVSGTTYWMSPATADALSDVGVVPDVHLLPGFDEFVLGYKDRSAVLDAAHSERIVPGGNGVFRPTVVIDGRIAGTWKRVVRQKGSSVETTPFTRFTSAERRAIDAEIQRYLEFVTVELPEDRVSQPNG